METMRVYNNMQTTDYTLWSCKECSRTGPLVFIDVVTPDRLYNAAHIQPNNSKMIANATQEFDEEEKCDSLQWASQSHLILTQQRIPYS